MQLELFPETTIPVTREEFMALKDAVNKMRKSLFAANTEMTKILDTLQNEVSVLKGIQIVDNPHE